MDGRNPRLNKFVKLIGCASRNWNSRRGSPRCTSVLLSMRRPRRSARAGLGRFTFERTKLPGTHRAIAKIRDEINTHQSSGICFSAFSSSRRRSRHPLGTILRDFRRREGCRGTTKLLKYTHIHPHTYIDWLLHCADEIDKVSDR